MNRPYVRGHRIILLVVAAASLAAAALVFWSGGPNAPRAAPVDAAHAVTHVAAGLPVGREVLTPQPTPRELLSRTASPAETGENPAGEVVLEERADLLSKLPSALEARLRESGAIADFERFFEAVGHPTDSSTAVRVAMIFDETVRDYNRAKRELIVSVRGSCEGWQQILDSRMRELLDQHWSTRLSMLAPYAGETDLREVLRNISGGWSIERAPEKG